MKLEKIDLQIRIWETAKAVADELHLLAKAPDNSQARVDIEAGLRALRPYLGSEGR